VPEDARDLKAAHDAEPRHTLRIEPRDLGVVVVHRPRGRLQKAAEKIEEGRLACAVRPDDAEHAGSLEAQIDARHRDESGEFPAQAAGFEHGRLPRSARFHLSRVFSNCWHCDLLWSMRLMSAGLLSACAGEPLSTVGPDLFCGENIKNKK